MSTSRINQLSSRPRVLGAVAVTLALLASVSSAQAAQAPVKEILTSQIGREVNLSEVNAKGGPVLEDLCTVVSKDECKFGAPSSEAAGFLEPEGIAVDNAPEAVSPEHGDIYVADAENQRVQVLSATGVFVLMFGWDVNKTKEETAGASQAERDVCTAQSKDVCQTAVAGGAAGQLANPTSMAVDPATGNVYVEEAANWRVQEFTATGEFVLMLGKGVDETTPGNICTAKSHDQCRAGEQAAEESTEPGAFDFESNQGNLLAVGGPEDLLYIGDRHRVQTFKTDGAPAGEGISLTGISSEPGSYVSGLAVDQAGDVYAAYVVNSARNLIYELNPMGAELGRFELAPRHPEAGGEIQIRGVAIDPAGRLGVTEREVANTIALRGSLYEVEATSLHLLTEFDDEFPSESGEPRSARSLAFNGEDDAYGVGAEEVRSYTPLPVAELSLKPVVCKLGTAIATDATFECDLEGEANPWGIPGTQMWFQWGETRALGAQTAPQALASVEVPLKVSSQLGGLLPNETYYYRQAGEDQNVKAPELLHTETTSLVTEAVAPRIVGEPATVHVGSFSAVMFGELNPENTNTTYQFQYGPCEALEHCAQLAETEPVQSSVYGATGTTVEVNGLAPDALYHYRLIASSPAGTAASDIGSFTTALAPGVSAETTGASAITSTGAVIAGVVNPDGQAATYAFELGRYNGAGTQFGIVYSGPAGAGASPIEESLALSGLQPGATYAYRIALHSGDGSARGAAATGVIRSFTTAGLPSVLSLPPILPQLTVPNIPFPKAVTVKATTKALTRAQKLTKALRACEKAHKSKRQRAACKRQAKKHRRS
jgi:DNA-binding beta-propeller fold protein YncE